MNSAIKTDNQSLLGRRTLCLLEIMNKFKLKDLATVLMSLESVESKLRATIVLKNPGGLIGEASTTVSDVLRSILAFTSKTTESASNKNRLFESGYLAADTACQYITPSLSVSALVVYVQNVRLGLCRDIAEHEFLYVPKDKLQFLEPNIFGEPVAKMFKKASNDIRASGECLAADCSTASVFHLMRVAEYGLRAIARKLNVKLTHKGVSQPIEFADWNDVITGIKNKISHTRKLPRSKRKEQNLVFYSDLADQCEYIKDIWRNTISHTRRPYCTAEAVGILTRVRGFMKTIATDMRKVR